MIKHLNNLLRHLLMMQVANLRPDPADPPEPPNHVREGQVGFQPPDRAWRNHVGDEQRNALNAYLADVRENRNLRSNDRGYSIKNGTVSQELTAARAGYQVWVC
jgi:hypothetical protein